MKNVRVDETGALRCYNCGGRDCFESKRTTRSKMTGLGALATKKKLKCRTCGEYNDPGNAQPYTEPASRKWRKRSA